MLKPKLPDYDIDDWSRRPFDEQIKMVCQSWAVDGYGSPLSVPALYVLKILGFIGVWLWLCVTFTPQYTLSNIDAWWASDTAFQKAIFWAMLFEGLGLGCGAGPLTARYLPPFGGALYFLRPGTVKMPLFPGLPLIGGDQRTAIDVMAYASSLIALGVILTAPTITTTHIIPVLVLVPLMGILDKTLFLVHRSEHYLSIAVCLMFTDWTVGAMWVWLALWFWAGVSKVNHHFPSVVGVMLSNAPWTRWTPLRRWMYQSYPDDLRPSRFSAAAAHLGALNEFAIPLVLFFGDGGLVTWIGLAIMLNLHLFISSTVPMGVPMEWNVIMIYGALVLFGVHAETSVLALSSPWLIAWLLLAHLVVPLYGNLAPHRVSFLLAHRYYAGNWPYSVWLFKGDSAKKLDAHITKWSPLIPDQLRILYDDKTIRALISKVIAFRMMHTLGRALRTLAPRAVDELNDYEWLDGELVAGLVIGWNFGDGHLSQQQLVDAVQKRCQFEEGELRCIFVESQPLHRADARYKIIDARSGVIDEGVVSIGELLEGQPWSLTAPT